MPVTAAQLAPSILTQLTARGIKGSFASGLASGVASGVESFVATLMVQGQATGTLGAGVGTGKWILDPASGSVLVTNELRAAGLLGAHQESLAQGIVFGTSTVINASAIVQVAFAGVAVGAGTGTITNSLAATAIPLIYTGLIANGIVGSRASSLAKGIGSGLSLWFQQGAIILAVAGTPVIPPVAGQGVGIGKIL